MRFFQAGPVSCHRTRKHRIDKRRLSVEPLESRTLLSVSTGVIDSIELNPTTHTDIQSSAMVQSSGSSRGALEATGAPAPSSYDLRDYGDVTSVKSQGSYGTCWTFASYASLESSLLTASNTTTDFSERNLAYRHGFDWGYDDGGNSYITEAYLSRFSGPISESADPYSNMGTPDNVTGPVQYYVRDMLRFDSHSEIKTALMTYGAVYTSMYWDSDYFRSSDCTYYYDGSGANHAVTIVGWDDAKATAGGTGAWIVKNSWGTGWADGGYFWLSYQDSGGQWAESFHNAVAASTYSKAYYHDTFGDVGETNTPYAFNKYVATSACELKSVGFFTAADGAGYTISVYDTYSGGRLLNLLGTVSGTATYAGYHTVDLVSAVSLSAGNDFYVSLHVVGGGTYCMAIDYAYPGYSSASTAAAGQSYYSFDGQTWTDLTTWISTANFCIKALVVDAAPVSTPAISNVVVNATTSANKTSLTWHVSDAAGIMSTKLTIDGRNVSVWKTSGNRYDANYSASATLAAGTHTFTITEVDNQRVSQTYTGTFTVAATAPTISNVAVEVSQSAVTTISWKVSDGDGVGSTTLTLDEQVLQARKLPGNRTAARYSASTTLAAGTHTYTITAVDSFGVSSTYSGTFTITSSGRKFRVLSGSLAAGAVKTDWRADNQAICAILTQARQPSRVDAVFATF
jgi:C1A family cysteine protease